MPAANVPDRPIVCDVNSNPQTVRAEGFAELLGDIEIVCRGYLSVNRRNSPTSTQLANPVDAVNISVTLSVPVTSRYLSEPFVEAMLLVDDPVAAGPGVLIGGSIPAPQPGTPIWQNPCNTYVIVTPCGPYYAHDGFGTLDDGLQTAATPQFTPALGFPASNQYTNPINIHPGWRPNNQTVVFTAVPVSNFDTRGNPRLLDEYNRIRALRGGVYSGEEILVPFEKRLRIKNLRGAIPGAASANGQVFAFLSIQNTSARLQLNTASAVVGFVQPGLTFRQRNLPDTATNPIISFVTCTAVNRDLAVDATDSDPYSGGGFIAQYTEGFRVGFRLRGYDPSGVLPDQNDPRKNYDTESGFYNRYFPSFPLNLNRAGIADHGTRLRAVVRNVPANIRVFASAAGVWGTPASTGAYAVLTDSSGANLSPLTVPLFPSASPTLAPTFSSVNQVNITGAPIPPGTFVPAGSIQGLVLMPQANGTATMTWELYAADSTQLDSVNFVITVAYRPANNPGTGTATVQASFAPVHTTASAAGFQVPVPRFAEAGSPQTAFTTAPCLTNLLFPFVTNQSGFNTGLTIANTSLSNPGTGELFSPDPNIGFGLAPQDGACTLNYFGTTGADGAAPPPATTAVIPAGRTFAMTLASGSSGPFGTVPAAANFQGYVIAQCSFRFAHGYAFISDLGAAQLAHGYAALVMDATVPVRTGNSSESLGR